MNSKYWLLQALIGAAIGFCAVVLLEVVVIGLLNELLNARLHPRGLFWIAFPFIGAGFGWKFGRSLGAEGLAHKLNNSLENFDRQTRIWVAASIIWLLSSAAYMFIVNPFGYYWDARDWQVFWSTLIIPVIMGGLALRLTRWINKADQKSEATDN